MIRSRDRSIEEGEKPSKYFCNFKSLNLLNKTIQKIKVEGKGMVYEQSEVLKSVQNYFENLYTCNDSNLVDVNLEDMYMVSICICNR